MKDLDDNLQAKKNQFVSSLKFHHAQTLRDMPLDVALAAFAKAWESSQEVAGNYDGDFFLDEFQTLILDRQHLNRAIRL